ARVGHGVPDDVVGIPRGGEPGAELEELPQTQVLGHVAHGALHEGTLAQDDLLETGGGPVGAGGQFTVHFEVVLALEVEGMQPGKARTGQVDCGWWCGPGMVFPRLPQEIGGGESRHRRPLVVRWGSMTDAWILFLVSEVVNRVTGPIVKNHGSWG